MNVIKMKPSHLPILNAVIKSMMPTSCIECGSGVFSTPLLAKIHDFQTIEHDSEWAQKAIETVGEKKVLVHPLPIRYNVYPKKTNRRTRNEILRFYRQIARPCDLLFIDSYAAVRDIILAVFWGKFNAAVLHDTQNPAYGYQRVINRLATPGYFQVQCIPEKAGQPWTDIILPRAYYAAAKDIISQVSCYDYPFAFTIKEWLNNHICNE